MQYKRFVKSHLSTLEHFIEQNGWPLAIRDKNNGVSTVEAEEICRYSSAFFIQDNLLKFDKDKKVPAPIMAEFYKIKYLEAKKELQRIFKITDKFTEDLNS